MRVPLAGDASQLVANSIDDASPSIRCAPPPAALCVLAEETPDHTQLVFTEIDPLRGRGREFARYGIMATPDAHYDWDFHRTVHVLPFSSSQKRRSQFFHWPIIRDRRPSPKHGQLFIQLAGLRTVRRCWSLPSLTQAGCCCIWICKERAEVVVFKRGNPPARRCFFAVTSCLPALCRRRMGALSSLRIQALTPISG